MTRRLLALPTLVLAALAILAAPAFGCGGLVAPGHAEVLQKATTLAAWHDGLEHYVTGFQFAGAADRFGYIVPLPGVPSKIEKAGQWTLERLEREVNPVKAVPVFAAAAGGGVPGVEVLQRARVDALDITVVRGGGSDVAAWAKANGFDLTPDTPRVLGAYSSKGAVFALARFSGLRAANRGLVQGQGTIVHFVIPTQAPWIPLRILALGKVPAEVVDADLFVLTDHLPVLSPAPDGIPGTTIKANGPASAQLLADLRSDRGMGWLPPRGMWLTALTLHTTASALRADLSIDGGGPPLARSAVVPVGSSMSWPWWLLVAGFAVAGVAGMVRLRTVAPPVA